MEQLKFDELTLLLDEVQPDAIRVTWKGKSTGREPAKVLGPIFTRVLDTAAAADVPVEMHFEEIEHFNSSTIAAVIQLINAAQEKKVSLRMYYDATAKWQSLSFEALTRALRLFDTSKGTVRIIPLTLP